MHSDFEKIRKTLKYQGKMVAACIQMWYSIYRSLSDLIGVGLAPERQLNAFLAGNNENYQRGYYVPLYDVGLREISIHQERISLVIYCLAA